MTFQQRLTELTRHTAAVLLPRAELPAADLPIALAGHHALVLLLRHLHPLATGVGAAASPTWSGVEDVEAHPVALLGRLLSEHPTMSPISPIDAQVTLAESRQGVHWQQIGRHATVAMADWQVADHTTRPRGEAAWTLVAHLAGLSRALPILDVDLSRVLTRDGHPEQAGALAAAETSGLATVAATVLDLAHAGPLPELQLYPAPELPIRVDSGPAAAAGQHRLARLLERGPEIHPADVALISKLQWRTATAAAAALAGDHPELAGGLRTYARALTEVPPALARTVSLGGRNSAAVAQARQLHDYLARNSRTNDSLEAAQGFAAHCAAVASALHAGAGRALAGGKWLVVAEDAAPGGLWWTRSRPGASASALDRLATVQDVTRPWQPAASAPHEAASVRGGADASARQDLAALAGAVAQRVDRVRPASPAERPQAFIQRRPAVLAGPSLSQADVRLLEQVADGTPVAEIAQQLEMSPSTAHARLSQIYARLRDDALPARRTRYRGQRAALAAEALDVVAALAETAEARREVERLTDLAYPSADHAARLLTARTTLRQAQQRLDAARQHIAPDKVALSPKPDKPHLRRRLQSRNAPLPRSTQRRGQRPAP